MPRESLIAIIDSHCHLPQDAEAAEAMILRLQAGTVNELFIGGYDPDDWRNQLQLKSRHPTNIHMSFGLHPWFVHNSTTEECETAFAALRQMVEPSRATPAGIGETGLDHALARTRSDRERQAVWFRRHLELAAESDIPPVLHIVRAWGAALEIMSGYAGPPGMVHAFSGDRGIITQVARLGFLMSIGPAAVAAQNSQDLALVPDHLLAIESDAPTGALPAAKRGRDLIDPSVIIHVAGTLANIRARGEDGREILKMSCRNLRRQFRGLCHHP